MRVGAGGHQGIIFSTYNGLILTTASSNKKVTGILDHRALLVSKQGTKFFKKSQCLDLSVLLPLEDSRDNTCATLLSEVKQEYHMTTYLEFQLTLAPGQGDSRN